MTNTGPNDPYLGFSRFSYIPDGLVSHIATSPGLLCSLCSVLDFSSYLIPGALPDSASSNRTTSQRDEVEGVYHDAYLGTYDEVTRRSLNCIFCQLVITASRNATTALQQESLSQDQYKVFLDSDIAGSYYNRASFDEPELESNSRVDVRCMKISFAGRRTEQLPSAYIRLLANDAHCLGQKPMYHGRLVGNHVSPTLLRTWITTCKDHHTICNTIRDRWGLEHLAGPRSLRYIDTVNMCLRPRHWYELTDHVALSYVWGGSQGLQLVKSNQKQLYTKGALSDNWSNIPAVIKDAIELVRDINTNSDDETPIYLWVDQLCIIQDDPKDKVVQIQQMNHTYSRAVATLIATEGSHSNVPLSRHQYHSVSTDSEGRELLGSRQVIRNIQGLRLVAALPSMSEVIAMSRWNTRAWTMQEAELSHASLIFGKDQVMFRCAQEVFKEDFVAEVTGEGYRQMQSTSQPWQNSQASERRVAPAEDKDWPMTFEMYARLVESYTLRAMTYPTDILPAFQGMSQVLHAVCGWKILNGLVEDVIDFSLLWRPNGRIKRRFTRNGDPEQTQQGEHGNELCLPTYSWCAWSGPVTYNPLSLEIRSLIKRFEILGAAKQRRGVVRFSQVDQPDSLGLSTLDPEPPYAPQDCSTYEDLTQTLYWVKPQAQNLAYRMHLTKNAHQQNIDGPWILQFTPKCVHLKLDTLSAEEVSDYEQAESGKRVWLLNHTRERVGTVWYVPGLEEYSDKEVDVILLSKNKVVDLDEYAGLPSAYNLTAWCMCNVMLIKRLPGEGLSERLTIGKLHERATDDGWEETIKLV
ncbi:MAG: hypothetical protein Q9224_004232 [Gallowayella concinna]